MSQSLGVTRLYTKPKVQPVAETDAPAAPTLYAASHNDKLKVLSNLNKAKINELIQILRDAGIIE